MLSTAAYHLLNRRSFLSELGSGLSSIALVSLLQGQGVLAGTDADDESPIRPQIDPAVPSAKRPPHFAPKAKRVLQIFCSGACSHLDTWDYKPELIKRDGQPLPSTEKVITFQGENGNLTKSPYAFRQHGESGKWISDLLPNLAGMVDDMCFVHSLTARTNTHGPAELQMNTGFSAEGFPSVGAWTSYALGTQNQDLPAYVAITDPRGVPQAGPLNWTNGFLPAAFQGTSFNADQPIANLARPKTISADTDLATRDFLKLLNDEHLRQNPNDTELSARIAAYELAARMQLSAPEVSDLTTESKSTQDAYGLHDANPLLAGFGRNCLLARRLLERDVRFVTLFNGAYAMGEGVGNWDGHKILKSDYDRHGPILDKPAAALLQDLKQRGLLEDTLVVWCTEFGRMPTFQKGANGRDHNPHGFTAWLAGAGVKRAFSYGATDEFGHKAVEKVSTIYDLHATILHLLGLNHKRLSVYHNGIERRLTDVHGLVLKDILA